MIKKVTLAVIPSGVQLLLWNPHTIMYNSSSNIDTEVEFDIITIIIIITTIIFLIITIIIFKIIVIIITTITIWRIVTPHRCQPVQRERCKKVTVKVPVVKKEVSVLFSLWYLILKHISTFAQGLSLIIVHVGFWNDIQANEQRDFAWNLIFTLRFSNKLTSGTFVPFYPNLTFIIFWAQQ